jgi:hypothetical protein
MSPQLIRQRKFILSILILDSLPNTCYMNFHQFNFILFTYLLVVFLTTWSAVKLTWWWMVGWLYEEWKRVIVAQSEVLAQHMPGDRWKSMRNLSHVSQAVGQDLNSRPPKYEVGVLSTHLWHSFLVLHIYLPKEFPPTNRFFMELAKYKMPWDRKLQIPELL